ncbi:hypothetical protein [Fluviicola sp.]|uniref:hypothetical protein n=1 Tax=Fluviicola sp. TaxID=1917219 RepID=UPI003D28A5DE
MALYQFYLAVIPRVGLVKKLNHIPDKISIGNATGYFESNTEQYWKIVEFASEEIIKEMDKLVDRADWGNDKSNFNWKTHTEELDHDASLSTNPESGKIEEFSFRADLRESDLKFLKCMIDLANKYDFLFMDLKGNVAPPNEIGKLIEQSNAYKFLQNPLQFLTDQSKGETSID